MTIDEAIELLDIASSGWPMGNNEDYYKALELSIEALKRERQRRKEQTWGGVKLLRGETEE